MIGQKMGSIGKIEVLVMVNMKYFVVLVWILSVSGRAVVADVREELGGWSSADRLKYLAEARSKSVERELYIEAIRSIQKSPSDQGVEVLESVLNRDDLWAGSYRSETATLLRKIRPDASRVWYELKWAKSDLASRIKFALYSCQPNPPVHVDHAVGLEYAQRLKGALRQSVYEILLNKDMPFSPHGWDINSMTNMQRLIESVEALHPSKEDVNAIRFNGGDFGKTVLLTYLVEKQDPIGAELLMGWLVKHENNTDMLYVLTYAKNYKGADPGIRSALADRLAAVGESLLKRVGDDKEKDIILVDNLSFVIVGLDALGKTDKAVVFVSKLADNNGGLKILSEVKDDYGVVRMVIQSASELNSKWN